MKQIFKYIAEYGVLPVISAPEPENSEPLAQAISDGGLPLIEITFRNGNAKEVVRRIKASFPEILVGAGTILNKETAQQAVSSGADFLVSPGFNLEVYDYCREREIPFLPGCVTPCEIEKGLKEGIKVFKFFPAEPSGGVEALKLISGPYSDVSFVPTGGITFSNLSDYLSLSCVAACGGSFMAAAAQIAEKNWAAITAACRNAVNISLGFELAHVGINCGSSEEALSGAKAITDRFRLPLREGNSSIFAGTAVEFMKTPYYGEKGHIGFEVRSAARAEAWLRRQNIPLLEESIRRSDDGKIRSIYLAEEICGFALHIVEKDA